MVFKLQKKFKLQQLNQTQTAFLIQDEKVIQSLILLNERGGEENKKLILK